MSESRMMIGSAALLGFAAWRERLVMAEQGDGWLSACADQQRFLAPSTELVEALAGLLRRLAGGRRVLEVCAGQGELAAALSAAGVPLVAVDAAAAAGTMVEPASAESALGRYRPAVVLGVFVPVDAGVDEAVLGCDSVEHYVILGARLNGMLGSTGLWRDPQWRAGRLSDVDRWMLTRHDVWLGGPDQAILRPGEAWHFHRADKEP